MSYGTSDPRASLATSTTSAPTVGARPPQYFQFDLEPAAEVSPAGSPTRYFRGQNFVMSQTRLQSGDSLDVDEEHEYVVILSEQNSRVTVSTPDATEDIAERALAVVPAGRSSIAATGETLVTRLFDSRSPMMQKAANAAAYAEADPNVTLLTPWPDPVEGPKLRVYYPERIEAQQGRFGRIFRTSAFMVNFLDDTEGPRDPEKLSPHHHDDFEQCSLVVEGAFIHHIRTPWTPKRSEWRPDEHQYIGSPSATIIPPPTVHTSEAASPGTNRLIDIFCPPREDFSAMDGWVLNADEYPQPEARS